MGGLFIALLLAPVAASIAGYWFVRPRTSSQGVIAVGCAIALMVAASWLFLRFDESTLEAAAALALIALSALGLWRARSAARAPTRDPASLTRLPEHLQI